MNAPRGSHASGDGSFGRDAGTQTTKAVVLVVIAVIVGIVLLSRTTSPATTAKTAASHPVSTTVSPAATTTTTTTLPPPAPQTVKVLVFNGTTAPHGAGYFSTKLQALNYDTLAPEDATTTTATTSMVYANVPSYLPSAKAIAQSLGLPATAVQASLPATAPVSAAVLRATTPDVVVLIGSDISGQSLAGIDHHHDLILLERLLAPFRDAPGQAAVLTDFDGTLAPIVDDPEQAVALDGVDDVLARLVARYGLVGVISGRPVRYLQQRLGGIDGLHLAGLYGLERATGTHVEVVPEARQWTQAIERAADAADAEAPPGVRVERKGLALTLHVRTAPEHAGWISRFARDQAAASGLHAHPGRQSVELRPPVATDKGTVVADLGGGYRAVCYLGDDRGDLPAFDRLAALRAAGVATLAVAARSQEAPPDLLERADLVVDGPSGALAVLRALAG